MNITKNRLFLNVLKLLHLTSVISVAGGFLSMLAILLSTDTANFSGAEILYDKMALTLFNTTVTYGAFLMIITMLLYSCCTEWGFVKHWFIIIKWGLTLAIALVAYFGIGAAVSGMASISDAGYHMTDMAAQYGAYRTQATAGLLAEALLLALTMFVSIRKPFGKRDTKPFKYRKALAAVIIVAGVAGIIIMFRNQGRILKIRNMPINKIELSALADGEYDGTADLENGRVCVRVTVKDHRITEIEDTEPRDSVYAKYARGVFGKIIKEQTPNVDAVTGATTSSKGFMKAVENALSEG